jgi:L-aspartate oxidase
MASYAAVASIQDLTTPIDPAPLISNWQSGNENNPRRASQINAHWLGLRGEMTSYAGIVRTEAGLQDLLHLVTRRRTIIEEYYWKHRITRDFIELRNIILNAELIVSAALSRRESRGGHYREDFPHKQAQARESIAQMSTPLHAFFT